jgi:20S proteasome subunit beta 7
MISTGMVAAPILTARLLLLPLCVQPHRFLGMTDLYGSMFEGDVLATGYGMHLAIPLLRKRAKVDMSFDDAKALLEDCMRVLFYRDTRMLNSVSGARR